MGLNKRDRQAMLNSQSLIDAERSQQTSTTTTSVTSVDHGSIALPLESLVVSSSTSASNRDSQQHSSSSKSSSEAVHSKSSTSRTSVSEGRSTAQEQKFSTVSSMRSSASKSKQIDNIIEEIRHIASDTVGATEMIGTTVGAPAHLVETGKVSQKTVLVTSGGGTKESFVREGTAASSDQTSQQQAVISAIGPGKIEITKMGLDSNVSNSVTSSSSTSSNKVLQSSAITKTEQKQSSHSAMSSEKIVSESSANSSSRMHDRSLSSNVVQLGNSEQSNKTHLASSSTKMSSSTTSSSSSTTAKNAHSQLQSSSETFHSSNATEGGTITQKSSGLDWQDGGLTSGGRTSSVLPDHSTFDQKTFQLVGEDGKTRQHVDSQRYSMAHSQAPATKVMYDAAGNQITSTSSSYQSAQGHSTSSFQSSDGANLLNKSSNVKVKHSQGGAISNSSTQRSDHHMSTSSSTGMSSSSESKGTIIDSTTLENFNKALEASSGQHSNNMLTKTESAHTVASLSSVHDSQAGTIQSTQLVTESSQSQADSSHRTESTKTHETASHYAQMDEESRSRRKTSEYREQRESNSAILKRKTYDEHGRRLNLIDEKIVPKDIVTADLQDNVTNVTKTSFEAKLFNPKLKRWELVDQKTILEQDITTDIPAEIVKELEVERPELANITTTIQLTKVYDAKTKQWKTIDQKKHIDVLEKITFLEESSGRSELDESERTKNLRSMDMVDRVTIKEVNDRNKSTRHKDERSVQEQCICEICTCGMSLCIVCFNKYHYIPKISHLSSTNNHPPFEEERGPKKKRNNAKSAGSRIPSRQLTKKQLLVD
uniref:Uncharacterized protein n=1 Tax=Anopheles atroparvus TaxID=41427 RepID=A0A182JM49_ANOAO